MWEKIKSLPTWALLIIGAVVVGAVVLALTVSWKFIVAPLLALIYAILGLSEKREADLVETAKETHERLERERAATHAEYEARLKALRERSEKEKRRRQGGLRKRLEEIQRESKNGSAEDLKGALLREADEIDRETH